MRHYLLAGIDLAWMSTKNPTAIAYGTLSGNRLSLVEIHENLYGTDSIIASIQSKPELHGIAIDAPLIIQNKTGARACERLISSAYSRKKASCHPSNLDRYPDSDSVHLGSYLENTGFEHLASPHHRWQLECYPHPALIEIFGLEERHLYKKGSVAQKRLGQIALVDMIRQLEDSHILKLCVPERYYDIFDHNRISILRGKLLKHNEDILDSIICLYVAGLYQVGVTDRVFGDPNEGYIYIPKKYCFE